jgi:hypothetical protein
MPASSFVFFLGFSLRAGALKRKDIKPAAPKPATARGGGSSGGGDGYSRVWPKLGAGMQQGAPLLMLRVL